LGLFIQQKVGQASESRQTPDFGSFYLDDRGEMVISLRNQSFDALKNRAFSALKQGNFLTLKELIKQIIEYRPSSPEALYLEYRLMLSEGNFEKVLLLINKLLELDFGKETIPLSLYDFRETKSQILENLNLLELLEQEQPLEIDLLTGSSKDNLKLVKPEKSGNKKIYSVESKHLGQLRIRNLERFPVYVYMIKIDSDGRLTTGRLWENEYVTFDGLRPQKVELSYTFIFNDSLGVCERYLISCPNRISHLSGPPPLGNVWIPEVDVTNVITLKQQAKRQVIRYQVQSFKSL
jgi:tetratricopeptide (TPR) repeat protein